MKFKILPVKNVVRMKEAGDALISRSMGMPGIGLIWAPTGYGKTTATTWYINQVNGVFVRAMELWSAGAMLDDIATELGIDVRRLTLKKKSDAIVAGLAETGRSLFIDEADYVVDSPRLVNILRDVHDKSSTPIILIGMHGIERKIRNNEQFTGRISQWVGFEGADQADARMLADGLCEVEVQQDLLDALHLKASPQQRGSSVYAAEVRRLLVGLEKIEQFAISAGLASIGLKDWPKNRDFFIGKAVAAKTPAKVTALRPVGDGGDQ